MTMFICWVVFPFVLALLSIGCGLLLEAITGIRLGGALLAPVGLAVMIVVASFTTMADATAKLTVPAVIALAVAGFGLSFPWRERRADVWALLAAVAVFAVYAAPIVLSGRATFAGYITLDDTSTWLAMTDRVMDHGRSLSGLAPSTYEATLANYLAVGSPIGANLPLGIGGKLVGTDIAWLFQPYLAFLGAMLALGIYGLVGRLVESRALRALVAFVAAQPALLYAYSLWSGMKELAAAMILVVLAALVPLVLEEQRERVRRAVPAATAGAALLAVLTVGGVAWLAALLIPALAIGLWMRGRTLALGGAAFAGFLLVLSIPSLVTASVFLRHVTGSGNDVFTSRTELGNLIRPLGWLQLFGIWPAGDFRISPHSSGPTDFLIVVVIVAAVVGLLWAWISRRWELLLYVATVVIGCFAITRRGSPWVGAKALATGSPAFLAAGLCGLAWIFQRGRRIEAAVVAAAIAGGVLWSNALAYHDVWLAPRSQLTELETIGNRFAGDGPTLMTEYQPYGVRHFLRRMDPEGASELRRRVIPLRNGETVAKGGFADIDEIQLDAVLVYRTLVLLRTPLASRPPSPYSLVWSGRFYEVWQRPDTVQPQILEHLSLGSERQPSAVPRCSDVLRLARLAGRGGRLAAVVRPPATVINLSQVAHPTTWTTWSGDLGVVYPYGGGSLAASVTLPETGRYSIWIGGLFRRRLQLSLDAHSVGTARHQLNHPGEYTPMGAMQLGAGTHQVTLRYGDANLLPGSGGTPFPLGPIVLSRTTTDLPVSYVSASDARSLCGKTLDWVEALGS